MSTLKLLEFIGIAYCIIGLCYMFKAFLLDDFFGSNEPFSIKKVARGVIFFIVSILFFCLCWPLYALSYESA